MWADWGEFTVRTVLSPDDKATAAGWPEAEHFLGSFKPVGHSLIHIIRERLCAKTLAPEHAAGETISKGAPLPLTAKELQPLAKALRTVPDPRAKNRRHLIGPRRGLPAPNGATRPRTLDRGEQHPLAARCGGPRRHLRLRNPNAACALALLRTALLAPVRAAGHQSLTQLQETCGKDRTIAVHLMAYQRLK